jgi:Stress responsive A/B Barrel Domain
MIRHVALFRWTDGVAAEQIAAVTAGLDSLPGQVPSIRTYAHGPDLRLGDGRWDYAVVADFDDADGYRAYVDHPAHDEVRRDLILPLVAERGNAQIQL